MNKHPKIKLPSLSTVRRALYADWALRVKQRDDWKCLLCGSEENLTAHHWYVSDHHAHAARYSIDNGATLCYACHIRSVHTRADYVTVQKVADEVGKTACVRTSVIDMLVKTELTTALLRSLWDAMRARPVSIANYDALLDVKGSKLFLTVEHERPIAVVGNTMLAPGFGLCEVAVVAPSGSHHRYTLRKIEE